MTDFPRTGMVVGLDVRIEPKGPGFSVAWTTVTYPGGEDSTAKVKRKSSTLDFLPSGRPGVLSQ